MESSIGSVTLIDSSPFTQRFLHSSKGHKNYLLSEVPGRMCATMRYDYGDQKDSWEQRHLRWTLRLMWIERMFPADWTASIKSGSRKVQVLFRVVLFYWCVGWLEGWLIFWRSLKVKVRIGYLIWQTLGAMKGFWIERMTRSEKQFRGG